MKNLQNKCIYLDNCLINYAVQQNITLFFKFEKNYILYDFFDA